MGPSPLPLDQAEQIDLEKPCPSPQRMPRNLDSGAKIGSATCLGTLVSIWPRGGGGIRAQAPGPLGSKSRVLDHSAPGGHSPGESSPRGIIPLGNHPLGNHPLGNHPLGNHPPGESFPWESSPWGIVPLGNRTPGSALSPEYRVGELSKLRIFASAANIV